MSSARAADLATPEQGVAGSRHATTRRIKGVSGTVLLTLVVLGLGLLMVSRLFGFATLTILSGSMAETAPVGSLVVVRPMAAEAVRIGDVILIRRELAPPGAPGVLHRVMSLTREAGGIIVTTKGDSNPRPDPAPHLLRGTTMTPVLAVPHLGAVFAFARTPIGWMLLVALPATWLVWAQLCSIWFPRLRPAPRPSPSTLRRGHRVAGAGLGLLLVGALTAAGALPRSGALALQSDSDGVTGNAFTTGTWCTPGSSTVTAEADAWLNEANVSQNRGTLTTLNVQSRSAANRRTLVRFALPAVPAGCTVTGATLQLFNQSPDSGRTIDVYRASIAWAETTVSWSSNIGTAGTAVGSATIAAAGWQSWSVLAHVQAQYAGPNNGFLLRDRVEGAGSALLQTYRSRENTTTPLRRPTLVINYG